jgi:hypothetical protein
MAMEVRGAFLHRLPATLPKATCNSCHGLLLPEWARKIVVGLAAFVGGRSLNAMGEAHRERVLMRDTMTRLTIGIESISADLHEIKGEVRTQVSALREEITKQVSEVKADLYEHQTIHERRMHAMEWRIDGVNKRIDAIAPHIATSIPPPHDDE